MNKTQNILQLECYYIRHLNINYTKPEDPNTKVNLSIKLDKKIVVQNNDPRRFVFDLTLDILPKPISVFKANITISGYFYVPESIDLAEAKEIVDNNGLFILYGVLRGLFSVYTSEFPTGRMTLPSIPVPVLPKKKKRKTVKS